MICTDMINNYYIMVLRECQWYAIPGGGMHYDLCRGNNTKL